MSRALFQFGAGRRPGPAHIRNPDDGTPALLLAYHNIIRILTFAPVARRST
ncbi:MAG: hypothetical protein R2867_43950 [Caldilineaceae bacterium]